LKEVYVRDEAEFSRFLHAVYFRAELCAEWIYETYYDHNYILLNYGNVEGSIKKVLFYEIQDSLYQTSNAIKRIKNNHADEWDNVEFTVGIKNVEDFKYWFDSLSGERLLFPPLDKLFAEHECCFKFLDPYRKPDDDNAFMEITVKYLNR